MLKTTSTIIPPLRGAARASEESNAGCRPVTPPIGGPILRRTIRGPARYNRLICKLRKMTAQQADAARQLQEISNDEIAVEDLRGKLASVRQEYEDAAQKWDQWEVERQMKGRVEELSPAARPLSPFRDTRLSFAGIGGFGGIVVGFWFCIASGLINRRLNRPDDADGGLHEFAMLGVLPTLSGRFGGCRASRPLHRIVSI